MGYYERGVQEELAVRLTGHMKSRTTVTKRDIAKEQLTTAIRLFFCDKCPCSVHSLACASLGVLQDILRKEEKDYLLNIERSIKPEKIKDWRRLVRKQANFLKHADSDPEGVLELNEIQTQLQILEAVNAFASLYGKKTYSMMVYQLWFACEFPGFFNGSGWFSFKTLLEDTGFETDNFTREDACTMLNLDDGADPEFDNSS